VAVFTASKSITFIVLEVIRLVAELILEALIHVEDNGADRTIMNYPDQAENKFIFVQMRE
jgi:hypothetical protein